MVLSDVIEEHAEEAAFLWQQRTAAVDAPDYDIEELAEADERVDAHLDGLKIGGERSWEICKELGWELPGEYFTAMSIAIRLARQEFVEEVLSEAEGDEDATRGVISALGWVEPRQLQGLVKTLLMDKSVNRRLIGIGACAIHRVSANAHLEKALQETDENLLARALKAVGELGELNLLPMVQKYCEHDDDACRFQAVRSAVLLGDLSALEVLLLFAGTENPYQRKAIEVALRAMEPTAAREWIRKLVTDKTQLRNALIACGAQGDPAYLPALMRQFENEELARVAGEAFEMITGLNIFRESLEIIPEAPVVQDTDDDDDEELGEDEGLVIPDPDKMSHWFEANKGQFQKGQRYLCGQPVSPEHCSRVLLTGQQRQRRAAAIELVLAQPGTTLFETRARGSLQACRIAAGKC